MAKIEVSHDRGFGFLLPLVTIREWSLYNDTYSAEANDDLFSRWVIAGELRAENISLLPHSPNLLNFLLALIKKIGN